MKTIDEIRHARLLELLQMPQHPTVQALAEALERSSAQISQWKNRSKRSGGGVCNIDSDSARHIESKVGKPRGWMDNDPDRDAGPSAQQQTPGRTAGTYIDMLPPEKQAIAFWIVHQMVFANVWPEFRPGAGAGAGLGATAEAEPSHAPETPPSADPSPAPNPAPQPSVRR